MSYIRITENSASADRIGRDVVPPGETAEQSWQEHSLKNGLGYPQDFTMPVHGSSDN